MSSCTTTRKGFRIDDITFRNARKQSEILKEISPEVIEEEEVKPPISITPEQVKNFYRQKIEVSRDSNEKRVYSQTIQWIDELASVKRQLIKLESKKVEEPDGDINDIVE